MKPLHSKMVPKIGDVVFEMIGCTGRFCYDTCDYMSYASNFKLHHTELFQLSEQGRIYLEQPIQDVNVNVWILCKAEYHHVPSSYGIRMVQMALQPTEWKRKVLNDDWLNLLLLEDNRHTWKPEVVSDLGTIPPHTGFKFVSRTKSSVTYYSALHISSGICVSKIPCYDNLQFCTLQELHSYVQPRGIEILLPNTHCRCCSKTCISTWMVRCEKCRTASYCTDTCKELDRVFHAANCPSVIELQIPASLVHPPEKSTAYVEFVADPFLESATYMRDEHAKVFNNECYDKATSQKILEFLADLDHLTEIAFVSTHREPYMVTILRLFITKVSKLFRTSFTDKTVLSCIPFQLEILCIILKKMRPNDNNLHLELGK